MFYRGECTPDVLTLQHPGVRCAVQKKVQGLAGLQSYELKWKVQKCCSLCALCNFCCALQNMSGPGLCRRLCRRIQPYQARSYQRPFIRHVQHHGAATAIIQPNLCGGLPLIAAFTGHTLVLDHLSKILVCISAHDMQASSAPFPLDEAMCNAVHGLRRRCTLLLKTDCCM